MHAVRHLLLLAGFLTLHQVSFGQQNDRVTDTLPHNDSIRRNAHQVSPYAVDSFGRKLHDPRKATIRSAIIPGWGQIYNRKYWKLPLVYAAIGIPGYTYFYNRSWYQNCQHAISIINVYAANLYTSIPDTIIAKFNPKLRPFLLQMDDNDLRTYRNEFRKNEDYSVLFFLLFWALNVVDATVDAHLMYFDVSDKLTMHLQQPSPGYMSPASSATGLSLVFDFHKSHNRALPAP
jgi:Family of unknown function (DUF5683)